MAAARGQVAPAQRDDPCAAAWLAPYPLVSGPLSGGAWTPCRFFPPSLGGRSVSTAPVLWLRTVPRTRTKRASSSSSGSGDGAGAELCCVGDGRRPVIVVCRSLRKDGNGHSAVLMKCPGRISCEPNTASAGENSLSSLKEALMPSITQGSGRASRRRPPGTTRRPSAACGTAGLIRLIEGGMLSWVSVGC